MGTTDIPIIIKGSNKKTEAKKEIQPLLKEMRLMRQTWDWDRSVPAPSLTPYFLSHAVWLLPSVWRYNHRTIISKSNTQLYENQGCGIWLKKFHQ